VQSAPDYERSKDIGGGFDCVSNESVGVPGYSGDELHDGQRGIHQHTDLGGLYDTRFGGHSGQLTRRSRKMRPVAGLFAYGFAEQILLFACAAPMCSSRIRGSSTNQPK
jgi:hypothetical protein